MNKLNVFVFTTLLAIGLLLGDYPFIYAQEEEFTLEEITVTAEKREENQQKVSIAMEVYSGADLKELGKHSIDDILSTISNVIINPGSDGLRVSIRGIASINAAFGGMQTSKPTVAVNKDGIFTNRHTGNTDLFDLERVEVLFGPQSTLYAFASPGGIVNVVTADPKLDTFESSGTLESGNYKLLKTEGSMNAPIGQTMAIRGAFSTTRHEGYLDNGGMDEDIKSGRVKFLYQPNEKARIVLTGEMANTSSMGYSGVKLYNNPDDATYPDGTPLTSPWTASERFTSVLAQSPTIQDDSKIYVVATYDLGYTGVLTAMPAYGKYIQARSGPSVTREGAEITSHTRGVNVDKGFEARIASSEGFPFEWLVGYNYYKSEENRRNWYFYTDDEDPMMDSNRISNSLQDLTAVYGNISYPVTDRFRLLGGIRYTWDEATLYNLNWNKLNNPDDPWVLEKSVPDLMTYNDWDYKFGLEYDIRDTSMLFFDYSTGYRLNSKGGSRTGMDKYMPPEKLHAYTLGAKNRFFGNRAQINLSVYYYDYRNYFTVGDVVWTIVDWNENGILDPEELDPDVYEEEHDRGQLTVGDATIKGFDVQSSFLLTKSDRLDLNISYVDKMWKDMLFDYYPMTNYLGLEDMQYSGMPMSNAPPWTVKFAYRHNFAVPNGGVLTPRLDFTWQDEYFLTWQHHRITLESDGMGNFWYEKIDRDKDRIQEAYTLIDMSMAYADPSGKWTVSLYGKNLGNYAVKRSYMEMGTELRIGPPRTIGAILSVKF